MSKQNTSPELSNPDIYGNCYVGYDTMIGAMTRLGLKLENATGRMHSAAVRFVGTIEGIEVTLNTTVGIYLNKNWYYVQSSDPAESKTPTHFKLAHWMPSNVNLRGKGSRGDLAWVIFRRVVNAIESHGGTE